MLFLSYLYLLSFDYSRTWDSARAPRQLMRCQDRVVYSVSLFYLCILSPDYSRTWDSAGAPCQVS